MRPSGMLRKRRMYRGLFDRGIWFFSIYQEIQLESVAVNVTIQDFVADVESKLFFRNKQQVSEEIMFVFPVDPDTVVYTFYATMGDTRIEAMLWDKEEAQKLHKATSGMENLRYLQDQPDIWGPVFVCFLGTLPPNRDVAINLCYIQELPLHTDGAALFCWPQDLFPQHMRFSWQISEDEILENLHFRICLQSACGVSHVDINSSHTPLQYTAPDQTSAEVWPCQMPESQSGKVSLKSTPWHFDDLQLLVYYKRPHNLSAVVESRDPKAAPGSLLGDSVVMVTLKPSIPEVVPSTGQLGEFLFLIDCSLFQDAQNTLLFLLKSLPVGCYFNIYSFGATFKAFYPQSVEYTQESMDNAVRRLSSICPDLGGCDLLGLLKSIYSTPLLHEHPRQLFIFIQRKISSEEEAIMAEVHRYRDDQRCFCFPVNSCDSFNLCQAISLETKGECVCIHSKLDMTSEDPEADVAAVTLKYLVGSQSFNYTLRFSLFPSADDRLPVHRMAMMHLLWKLSRDGTSRSEKGIWQNAVTFSLSLGVQSPFTSSIAVRMELMDTWHHDSLPLDSPMLLPPSHNLVPCQLLWCGFRPVWFNSTKFWMVQKFQFCLEMLHPKASDAVVLTKLSSPRKEQESPPEELVMEEPPPFHISWDWKISPLSTRLCDFSSLRAVVALWKANGSWDLTSALTLALGLSKAEVKGQKPSKHVKPTAWATVLALVWLHRYKWRVSWSELLEAKSCRWLQDQTEIHLNECLEAANSLLGCLVEPIIFRM
ncbi:von Willebrand factor A domain-containing protein 5A-like isoform X3 [Aythya fuligula]|uniref:von Willebrand factor A domain-containing protein 5A-like isoform X3 n=1 Tax=Aythya fuligula TaxID=219594 RepID=A0A6J3E4P7_AYTFU|nr:von Willebrand factor A domain-containing protein 5A-like isoform X3 [Aythya fuligula]